MSAWEDRLSAALATREEAGLLRAPRAFDGVGARVRTPDGRELLNLSSNDYLGLATHPALAEAAARAAREHGVGATASRLVVGGSPALEQLEARLAAHKGTEAALVVGSGFAANVAAIPALAGRHDAVFSDRRNHASIVDGCRLSGAEVHRYRHGDLDHLETLLARSTAGRKLVVTDSVFSMDGDVAPLAGLVELKDRYGAALYVDEAHAAGVYGPNGEGWAHEVGVADRVDVLMGTLSKAFGVYGAYLAGSRALVRQLQNSCRSVLYSTALPAPVVAAAAVALDLVREAADRRAAVRARAAWLRQALAEHGLDIAGSTTQIVPVVVGAAAAAVGASRALEERGVLGVAIRPPTVPEGTARIRFSVIATHTDADLASALDAMIAVAAESGIR